MHNPSPSSDPLVIKVATAMNRNPNIVQVILDLEAAKAYTSTKSILSSSNPAVVLTSNAEVRAHFEGLVGEGSQWKSEIVRYDGVRGTVYVYTPTLEDLTK